VSIRGDPPRRGEDTVDQRRLFELAIKGDPEAFGVLVAGHLARLDTAARLILRDPELARDAVEEATLRAWKDLRGLRDPDRLGAWLHRSTVNACLDIARTRRGRASEVELMPLHDGPLPDPTAKVGDALYVERMLATIDPAQRAVVVLHYYLHLTLPETAAALGITVGTARSRLDRALDAMRISVIDDDEVPTAATATERFA
jgi:RNA polymerase sigma-70 factor (ECF subfamily)